MTFIIQKPLNFSMVYVSFFDDVSSDFSSCPSTISVLLEEGGSNPMRVFPFKEICFSRLRSSFTAFSRT